MAMSFALTLGASVSVIAGILISGAQLEAATYTWNTGTTGTYNWTNAAVWTGGPVGTYPGQTGVDTVNFAGTQQMTVTLGAVVPNAVQINNNGQGVVVDIQPAGALTLTGTSSFATSSMGLSNTMKLTGGSLDITGANLTLATGGNPSKPLGQFSGGIIKGNGTGVITVGSGASINFDGASGNVDLNSITINNGGTINYSAPTSSLSLNGTTILNNTGTFNAVSEVSLLGSTGTFNNSGIFLKKNNTSGTFTFDTIFNNISPGVTQFQTTSGTISFANGGTHNGSFQQNLVTTYSFAGAHTFSAGGNITLCGGCTTVVQSGTFTDNSGLTIDNLTQNGGTINGSAVLNVNNTLNWNGGTQSGIGTTNMAGTSILSMIGTQALTLDGSRLFFIGSTASANYNPGAGGSLSINGGAILRNSGSIFLLNDTAINSDGTGVIDNRSTIQKNGGTGTSDLFPIYSATNGTSNTLSVTTGNLRLAGGGNFGAPATTVLDTGSGTSFLEIGGTNTTYGLNANTSFTGTGLLKLIDSATLNLNSGFNIGNFAQTDTSTLGGGGTMNVTGNYTWAGGTMDGPGIVSLPGSTPVLNMTGGAGTMTMKNNHQINANGATINYSAPSSALHVDSGSKITVSTGGSFNITNAVPIFSDGASSPTIQINSTSTLNKNAGSATSVNPILNILGTLNVAPAASGIAFAGGGTITGSVLTTAAGQVVSIPTAGKVVTLSGTPTISGAGNLLVNGGTLTNTIPFTLGSALTLSQGIINGSGTLTPAAGMTWVGGTMQGPGTTVIPAATLLDSSAPNQPLTLDARSLAVSGTFNYNPLQSLSLNNGSGLSITGTGVFDIQGDANNLLTNATGTNTVTNAGIIKKTAGTSGFRFDVPIANLGTIDSQAGSGSTIIVNAGGTFAGGNLNANVAGANLDFFNGTSTISGGTLTGAGAIRITGASANVQITGITSAPPDFQQLQGTLTAQSTFGVPAGATYGWKGGTITGAGGVSIATSGTMALDSASSALTLNSSTVTVQSGGAANWIGGSNPLQLTNGGILSNLGTFDIRPNSVSITGTGAGNAINNTGAGILRRSVGLSTADVQVPVTSSGSIDVQNFTLQLSGGATNSGPINIASGATLAVPAGNVALNSGTTLTGTGTLLVNGGTVAAATAISSSNALNLASGTLTLNAPLTATGSVTWTGATIDGTAGITASNTTITPGATNATLTGATFTNNGFTTLSGSSATTGLLIGGGGTFVNTASNTFNLAGDRPIFRSGTATINNAGIFTKTPTAGTSFVHPDFNNTGSVSVQSGEIAFLGSGTDAGTYNASAAGTVLEFAGGTRSISNAGGINIGPGSAMLVTGGTLTDNGSLTDSGGFTVNGGTLLYNGGAQTNFSGAFNLTSGTFGGTGGALISGSGTLTGGTITGSGLLQITGPVTINSPATNVVLDGRTVDLFSTINYTSTGFPLILSNSAALNVNAAGTFNITTDQGIQVGTGSASITNNGTFQKTAGSGTTAIGPTYVNGGDTNALSGTLHFAGSFTQPLGITRLAGGNIASTFGPMNYNGGVILGSGTITGTVLNNNATVNPGVPLTPGTITVAGTYTQGPGGSYHADLAGAFFDQLAVNGTANLDGNFNVALTGGYQPAGGESFPVLLFTTRNGDFVQPYGLPLAANVTWAPAYTANSLLLNTVANVVASADLATTVTGPATSGPGQSNVYAFAVNNGGPDPAATNTFNLTVTNGTILSVNTPIGSWTCGTITATTANCTLASLASGGNANLSVTVLAPASGTITVTGSASSQTPDPSTPNNTATTSTAVVPSADLTISKLGPSTSTSGANVTYSILVQNGGPSAALNVVVNDPAPTGTTFVSAAGPCVSFPCTIASLGAGQSATFSAVFHITAATGSITNTATVSSTVTADPNNANNSSSVTTTLPSTCPLTPVSLLPADGVTNIPLSGILNWNQGSNAQQYNVYLGVAGSGCSTLLGTTPGHQFQYFDLQPGTQYEWRVEGVTPNCPIVTSTCVHFTTTSNCNTQPPVLLSPADGAVIATPVTFSWSAVPNAVSYDVFAASAGSQPVLLGTTPTTSLTAEVPGGPVTWYVVAHFAAGSSCGGVQSATRSFNACGQLPAPVPSVIGQATTNTTYSVEWTPVAGATRYQLDEATNAAFNGATSQTVTATKVSFTHTAPQGAQPFFYRVRAFQDCTQQPGPYSETIRVVILPLPPKNQPNPSVNVPAGSTRVVVQQVFIEGIPDAGTYVYSATVDKPWLAVTPPTGVLPVDGVTLDVTANPAELPNGTFTGTVLVSITQLGSGKTATHATGSKAIPVSINLVTPVTVGPATSPQADSLIIPSVGHLPGVSSQWQSDIRVTNTSTEKQRYQLLFTQQGEDGAKSVKTTTIDVAGGDTTALDDIVRNWYGIGSLGDSANGVLEIRPVSASGKGLGTDDTSGSKVAPVASSRTYNVSGNGTLGQYIPAIPFASFIGKSVDPKVLSSVLSLQQVAQSDAFRTNVGVVEASGNAASVLLSVFDNTGLKLKDIPIELKAGEQKQLNGFLAANGVALNDGRITATVTNGSGKVTAYASVIDNRTGDPLLVSGVPLSATANNKYVLPGVADLNNGLASWRTDMRIFNNSTTPQAASLLFYPQNNGGAPVTKAVTINPGEVRTLDNVLQTLFEQTNTGGAMHITTPGNSSLVVTGRTYNQTENGTFGQFINAVTPFEAVGKGDRSLQILQVEDSVRYRTNLGLAEVSGREVNVEVTVLLPDSKVTPKLAFTLQPNEFRQLGIIRDLGLGNAYNARITVRVTDGDGRVTAYGSVIDMITQDPTYVPAQ
jgi:hypothetical protein